jgi:hypothetical protein
LWHCSHEAGKKGDGDRLLAITLTAHSCEKACSFGIVGH